MTLPAVYDQASGPAVFQQAPPDWFPASGQTPVLLPTGHKIVFWAFSSARSLACVLKAVQTTRDGSVDPQGNLYVTVSIITERETGRVLKPAQVLKLAPDNWPRINSVGFPTGTATIAMGNDGGKDLDMAYLKPPWFTAKIFNRLAMAFGIGGSQTLTVTKRGSKQPQQIPVVVPEVDGIKYLVSTRGESAWVRNVRAEPNVKLGDSAYVATELPVEQRAPVIAAYRPLAGKVVEAYWRELPEDADHPVFALTPAP